MKINDDTIIQFTAMSFIEFYNGGTRGSPIMPRDASLSEGKCWNGGQKWVNSPRASSIYN